MTRYWSIYKDQKVQNWGSGFTGLNTAATNSDAATRYDFEDDKLSIYGAYWNKTGPSGEGGWNLSVTEYIGIFSMVSLVSSSIFEVQEEN